MDEETRVKYTVAVIALASLCCVQFIAILLFGSQLEEARRETVRHQSRVHIVEAEISRIKSEVRQGFFLDYGDLDYGDEDP